MRYAGSQAARPGGGDDRRQPGWLDREIGRGVLSRALRCASIRRDFNDLPCHAG